MTTHDYSVQYENHIYAILDQDVDNGDLELSIIGEDISVGDILILHGHHNYTVAHIKSIAGDTYILIATKE